MPFLYPCFKLVPLDMSADLGQEAGYSNNSTQKPFITHSGQSCEEWMIGLGFSKVPNTMALSAIFQSTWKIIILDCEGLLKNIYNCLM